MQTTLIFLHKAFSMEGIGVGLPRAPRELIPVSGLSCQPHALTGERETEQWLGVPCDDHHFCEKGEETDH